MYRRPRRAEEGAMMSRFRRRHEIKHLQFPLGIVNLMLFGLVFVMILIGWNMVEGSHESGVAQATDVSETTDVLYEQVVCTEYESLKSKALKSAELCRREINGEFTDLSVFDQYTQECPGLDASKQQEHLHRVAMWRARCDYTDVGYNRALSLASELCDSEEAQSTRLKLIQEFYIKYLKGQAEFTPESTFEQDYPFEEYLDRESVIRQLTAGHTNPIEEHAIEFLQIDEEEQHKILEDRFNGLDSKRRDRLATNHIQAGYDVLKVRELLFEELVRANDLDEASEFAVEQLKGEGIEQVEDARIQQMLRTGNYAVVEQSDGTRVRVFPMNDSVNILVQ